jgi:hypothetical protein
MTLAKKAYCQAKNLHATIPDLHYNLATIHHYLQDYEEAKKEFIKSSQNIQNLISIIDYKNDTVYKLIEGKVHFSNLSAILTKKGW